MSINKIFNADIVDKITSGENAALLVNSMKSTVNLLVDVVNSIGSKTLIWSGAEVDDLDLTALTGGYPGDSVYLVTITVNAVEVCVPMYFTDGVHTQVTPIVGVDSVAIYKDDANNLSHYNADGIVKLEKVFG